MNAKRNSTSESPNRFVDSVQKSFSFLVEQKRETPKYIFTQDSYSLPILDTIAVNSTILAIKYNIAKETLKSNSRLKFYLDQLSNSEIENYFSIDNHPKYQTVYLKIKSSPLKIDKPEINFAIRLKNSSSEKQYYTRINLKIMDSTGKTSSKIPNFINPSVANYMITFNLTDTIKNSSIFGLQANSPIGSIISYRILNSNSNFYINNNMVKVSDDIQYLKSYRNNYLVIEYLY